MPTDTVSIIMPAYNCARYIAQSIESVLAQTYTNWELIIADDASTDDTAKIAERYQDCRIRLIRLEKQSGPATARNAAMKLASGDYTAFIDSDDLWLPDKLECQLDYMKKNNVKLSCTAYGIIDEAGNELGVVNTPPKSAGYWKIFFLGNPIGNTTAMYKTSAFPDAKVPDIKKRNDFALWLELTRRGERFAGVPMELAKYRVRKSSVSSNKISLIKYQWQLYRKIEGHSAFVSALAFASLAAAKGLKKISHIIQKILKR